MAEDIYVLGDKNTVLGFALVGIAGTVVHSQESFEQALAEQLNRPDLRLLFITQQAAAFDQERVDQIKSASSLSPVVVELPGSDREEGGRSLRELVQLAVGIDLNNSEGE